jgi:hypothetical protein
MKALLAEVFVQVVMGLFSKLGLSDIGFLAVRI